MTNKYLPAANWPEGSMHSLGNPTGIGIDSDQNILVFHRANRTWTAESAMPVDRISSTTILMMDSISGKPIKSWGEDMFIMPHGLTVDSDDNVWVTDVGLHQVFKFRRSGELLMTLGEANLPGNDSTHFNMPTDVAVCRDGSFYVSDGYGNNRVIKYSSEGKYLLQWGTTGSKTGEFQLPHAIELDQEENVYVADRENNRVQVFSPTGKFQQLWAHSCLGKISSLAFNRQTKVFAAVDYVVSNKDEVTGSEIILFDRSGNLIAKFGSKEGLGCWYHNIIFDNKNYIYVTDMIGNKIYKFTGTL
jgi:peptidylamidoglycolate lyase